jgi:hypothetical protein
MNWDSKVNWQRLGISFVRRNCRVPTTDRCEAEFDVRPERVWGVVISGEQERSETRVIEVIERCRQRR